MYLITLIQEVSLDKWLRHEINNIMYFNIMLRLMCLGSFLYIIIFIIWWGKIVICYAICLRIKQFKQFIIC